MTKKTQGTLSRLQNWYLSQCNGDWEHLCGIKIGNIDNPGWTIEVDILETNLFDKEFNELNIQRNEEHDWIQCKVKSHKFEGACGPKNLEEMINIFLNWANKHEV